MKEVDPCCVVTGLLPRTAACSSCRSKLRSAYISSIADQTARLTPTDMVPKPHVLRACVSSPYAQLQPPTNAEHPFLGVETLSLCTNISLEAMLLVVVATHVFFVPIRAIVYTQNCTLIRANNEILVAPPQ